MLGPRALITSVLYQDTTILFVLTSYQNPCDYVCPCQGLLYP
jgi:hypothetical protein